MVSVYAFSIENFKRPQEEVDVLMSLAVEKLQQLSERRYWRSKEISLIVL